MKLRVSVVSSPCDSPQEEGVGKSSLCQQFIYGRQVRVRKRWAESEWEGAHINKNHFLYWGSIPLRLPDGTETLIRLVEQTIIWRPEQDTAYPMSSLSFPKQAAQTSLPSPGKLCIFPEHASLYSHIDKRIIKIAKSEDMQYPQLEFTEEGINGFVCLIDPTAEGDRMTRQIQFLKSFGNLAKQASKKVTFVLSKCDLATEKQLIDARQVVRNKLKNQAPILEVSTVEMHNVADAFVTIAQRCLRMKPILQVLTWQQHKQARQQLLTKQICEFREYLLSLVEESSWTWDEFWQQLKSSSQSFLAANIQEGELKRLFCLHILELKLREAGGKYSMTPEDKTYRRLTCSEASESLKSYQEYLFNSIKSHPDLTPTYSKGDYSYYASVDTHMEPSSSMSPLLSPPPLPPRKESDDQHTPSVESPIMSKGKTKLFGSKKLRKTMSWGGKPHFAVDTPSRSNDNILQSPTTECDVSLFHSMLSSTQISPNEELPENKDDTFRRRAKTTSSGKYLHRPLPPSPGTSRIDKTSFTGMFPSFGVRNSPRHSRSRSDQLSCAPANQSFPDLSRISIDMVEPSPYLDPMDLKLQTMPRFRHSQLSEVDLDTVFSTNCSPKRLIRRENSFPFQNDHMRHSLDHLTSSGVPRPKRDISVQTYQRGQRRRESRWENATPQLQHRKRDISTSCACIQENTNEQDSGTASFICTPPPPSDPLIGELTNSDAMYDLLEPILDVS